MAELKYKNSKFCGVGINDAVYKTSFTKHGRRIVCPFYQIWRNMLKRCYSPGYQKIGKTYSDCTVCEEWKVFSVFKAWAESQKWQGKQLDKDLIDPGNKIYSPEKCLFVSSQINKLLTSAEASRGRWPVGVTFNKRDGKFLARCRAYRKQTYIGYFETSDEASQAYIDFKSAHIYKVAEGEEDPLRTILVNIADNFKG